MKQTQENNVNDMTIFFLKQQNAKKFKIKNERLRSKDNFLKTSQRQCNILTFNKLLCECAKFHNGLS
jgi:hypothetical protein